MKEGKDCSLVCRGENDLLLLSDDENFIQTVRGVDYIAKEI